MSKSRFFLIIFILAQIVLSEIVVAQETRQQIENDRRETINYKVSIEFHSNKSTPLKNQANKDKLSSLQKLLLQVSKTQQLVGKPPLSLLILKRRANSDIPILQNALRSRGYYSSDITYQLDTSVKPAIITFLVNTGSQYLISQTKFVLTKDYIGKSSVSLPSPESVGLLDASIADARAVKKAEKLIIEKLKQQSYAFAKLINKTITVNHKKHTMHIVFEVNPGPIVRFGELLFTGNKSVEDKFLKTLITWNKNDLYKPGLIKKTIKNIVNSNLFSTVRFELGAKSKEQRLYKQTVPATISLKENLHRSIKASLGFDTDTGATIGTTWTHRNYFSSGEKLSIEAAWTGVGPLLDIKFSKPSFYNPKQSFVANLKLQNEDTDAYDSTSFNMAVGIERKLIKGMKISLGLAFKHSQITDKSATNTTITDTSENYSLLYTPLKFNWDFSNDIFDPSKGGKLLVQGAPFVDLESNIKFGKFYINYSHYLAVLSKPRIVLAARAAAGQILGADANELPADERFYSGGGGAVRGYAYQLNGPLDNNNNPKGGKALIEFALEARINITQSIATVLFMDVGSAYSSDFFDGSSDLLYGAGLGLRYSSPIGPLRADIAVPVNARDNIDDSFQIYLSIGQAF